MLFSLSGSELVQGEPDASSFPSGGLRATFEASYRYLRGEFDQATELLRNTENIFDGYCPTCLIILMAQFEDGAGNSDAAIREYEQFVTGVSPVAEAQTWVDAAYLAHSYKRLGELHEEQGNEESAVDYYNRFVTLWSDADPELQPQVRSVRGRIARLVGEGR